MSESVQSPEVVEDKPLKPVLAYTFIMLGIFALAFSAIMVKEANFEPVTNAFLRCLLGFVTLIPFGIWEVKRKECLVRTESF